MARPNKGFFLEQSRSGRWKICWFDQGRKLSRSTGTADRTEADKVLAHFILSVDQIEGIKQEPLVGDIIARYWELDLRERVKSRQTAWACINHLTLELGALKISQLTREKVEAYKSRRRLGLVGWEEDGKQRGYCKAGNSTLRRELSVLIAAFNARVNRDILAGTRVPDIELPEEPPPKDRWLSTDECKKLYATAAARRQGKRLSRTERFVWLALHTGARAGAIRELTWSQVDFETRVIRYNPPGRKQTKKRRADVPMSDDLLVVMQRAYQERKSEFVLDHRGHIRGGFLALLQAAGVKGASPHTLRHTFATHLARKGVPLLHIARLLGDDPMTTSKRYAHHQPQDMISAVNMMNAAKGASHG